eukprot:TRINITY_DN26691_c0_g1_i1.p1 TRINITY_DN26691_c0_g1~~TRINITY_DN26691_c0_g1_i1.p1  ORF type:complete len:214 (+),score=42.56 TRINITY_DN26691_c0_g1_i1:49-690(+)
MGALMICWDMGGVISPNVPQPVFDGLIPKYPDQRSSLATLFRDRKSLWNRARIDPTYTVDQFWTDLVAGVVPETPSDLEKSLDALFVPFPGTLDILKTLHQKGVPMGVVSNHLTVWAEKFLGQLEPGLFHPDLVIISQTVQCYKPQKIIFELFFERVQKVHPHIQKHNILYIDDKSENVNAAKEVGFLSFLWNAEKESVDLLKLRLQSFNFDV